MLAVELDNAKACIVELEFSETTTVRRQEELFEDIRKRHAEEVGFRKENFAENIDTFIYYAKVANAESVKMPVEKT